MNKKPRITGFPREIVHQETGQARKKWLLSVTHHRNYLPGVWNSLCLSAGFHFNIAEHNMYERHAVHLAFFSLF